MKAMKLLIVQRENVNFDIPKWDISYNDAVENAIEKMQQNDFDAIAIQSNFSNDDINKLKAMTKLTSEAIYFFDFENVHSLKETIDEIMQEINTQKIAVMDNSFEMEVAARIKSR